MTVACVVKHTRPFAGSNNRHHARQHWSQPGPRRDLICIHSRKESAGPSYQRPDAVSTDVAVEVIELDCARDAKTIWPKATGHDLGAVVEKTDRRCRRLRQIVQQTHGDRIALHRINIEPIPNAICKFAATDAGTYDNAIDFDDVVGVSDAVRGPARYID